MSWIWPTDSIQNPSAPGENVTATTAGSVKPIYYYSGDETVSLFLFDLDPANPNVSPIGSVDPVPGTGSYSAWIYAGQLPGPPPALPVDRWVRWKLGGVTKSTISFRAHRTSDGNPIAAVAPPKPAITMNSPKVKAGTCSNTNGVNYPGDLYYVVDSTNCSEEDPLKCDESHLPKCWISKCFGLGDSAKDAANNLAFWILKANDDDPDGYGDLLLKRATGSVVAYYNRVAPRDNEDGFFQVNRGVTKEDEFTDWPERISFNKAATP